MSQYAFNSAIGTTPHILWQNILDTQVTVSYTADNEKQVLINSIYAPLLYMAFDIDSPEDTGPIICFLQHI